LDGFLETAIRRFQGQLTARRLRCAQRRRASADASVISNRLFGRRERSEPGRQAAKPPRRSAEREAVG